ncbi:MAG: Gfo/Idh/MocA family oxidoreductase [Kiritimatiellae bacterium]|nr:Gfo/Idh/MocA family oxidoreductase [Kiritimatiellia bacterium]
MATGRQVRVGLIGCGGNMRRGHLPRIRAARTAKVVAACDPVPESMSRLAEEWGKPLSLYAGHRRMIEREQLDAVIISTPHSQHYAQAAYALERGLHVLVEKPLTIKAVHAARLLELSKRKRRILHVSYQRHHEPVYRYIRELIDSAGIGEIRSVVGYVTQRWGRGHGWRGDPKLAGGGMFMDTGSHLVAAMLFLSGLHVKEVQAVLDKDGCRVDINTSVSVRFNNGAIGSLTTIGNASGHDERFSIHGDKGCIAVHQHQWLIRYATLNEQPIRLPRSLTPESPDLAFFKWIRGGKGYQRPTYALEVARLTEAVYKSAATGKAVRVRS